ncbi:MAG: nitroreductase family deazaflavin-dependent oxidoreductase [Acidimicrobiia bacterium]
MKLPPGGTRGAEVPKVLRPILKAMMGTGNVMFGLGLKIQGRPLLRLHTVGAQTGEHRRAILACFPDDERSDSWLIVASNAGSARHPSWAHNLAKNPDLVTIDVGKESVEVRAQLLTADQRGLAWDRVVGLSPGYSSYTTKTDREIPIFRLTALADMTDNREVSRIVPM